MSYAFLPALNKSLHATFLKVWLCRTWLVFHVSVTTAETLHTTSLCCHSLFGLHKCSASIDEWQWAQCFLHEGNQAPPFAPYTLPCQMPLRQSVPLLPSVAQQQNVMEYGWEGSTSTAISPPSASDVVSQHNKIGGVTFGAALIEGKALPDTVQRQQCHGANQTPVVLAVGRVLLWLLCCSMVVEPPTLHKAVSLP